MDVHRLSNVEARDVHARGGDASTRPSVRELEDDGDGVAAVAGETRGFGFDWEGERGVSSRDEADPGALGFSTPSSPHQRAATRTQGGAPRRFHSRWWRMSSTEPLAPSAPPLAPGGEIRARHAVLVRGRCGRDARRGVGARSGGGGASAPRADAHRQTVGGSLEDGTRGWGREGGSAKVRARRLGCAEDFEIHRPFCSGARKLMTCQHRWEMTERHPAVRRPVPLVGARSAVPSATTRARARSTAASSSSPVPVARRFAMRRRPGIAGIQQRRDKTDALRTVGEDLEQQNLETMRKQLAKFRASLEAFALKHKAEIRRDPAFRAQFHKMCANCGVDPLASNKGFWAEILGFGDFYYEPRGPDRRGVPRHPSPERRSMRNRPAHDHGPRPPRRCRPARQRRRRPPRHRSTRRSRRRVARHARRGEDESSGPSRWNSTQISPR